MDMNLQALRGTSRPKVVLYQFDQETGLGFRGSSEAAVGSGSWRVS